MKSVGKTMINTIKKERLQEIAEDGFLKHGESKEMARMLLAAQAHITELEAAPPAPVGPGEEPMPVMPDFPGKVMTQRECWQAGKKVGLAEGRNCAAIPDGYVMVPKEPTESMVIDGFESEPDETFSEPEVWEAYQKMSGCQQAAYRARLCWSAMLAAAPQELLDEK